MAAIIGEIVLVLLTTVAQEILVDGVHFGISSNKDLIIGGLATLIAGILTGFVTSFLGGGSKWPVSIISFLIVLETFLLIYFQKINNPVWFSILSSLSLIASVWVGFYIHNKNKNRLKIRFS
ncbi:hypothetical protein NE848_02760 [Gramella jeungdoensis]|uniref:Uncharacterized protein n=1 Tax=Gramella jeungdoensis TaxID=708091 RepID=A0ABT0YXT2_9FLAO|nr:hypothetical protein [Gramella jeungdoensis]MCM8568281.1 hypothetical protein [Gramella jeungdoensis]